MNAATPTNHPVHSPAWVMFTQASFALAIVALGAGLVLLDIELAAKGYLGMAALMVMMTSINLSKTLRDQHEASRLTNKVEEAKVSDFLMRQDPLAG